MTPGLGFWARTAASTLLRSGRASLALGAMLVGAVAMMIFLCALAVGVNDAMVRNTTELYGGQMSGEGLPASLPPEALRVEGVATVLKRIVSPGVLTHDARVAGAAAVEVDPEAERRTVAVPNKIAAGRWLSEARGEPPEIVLGAGLAEELGVAPGDEVRFAHGASGETTPLIVRGVFRTGVDRLDRELFFCAFGSLSASARSSTTWSAAVFLRQGENEEEVLTRLRAAQPESERLRSWQERMPDLRELIELNYVSMTVVLALVFGVVSLGVCCAFVIFILKNVRELGVMQAMGVTPMETALFIVLQIVELCAACAFLALGLGVGASLLAGRVGLDLTAFTSHNQYFSVSGVIHPRLTPFSLWLPPLCALGAGLAAAIWPAAMAARKRAAVILRIS